jgi:hypothetical protein
VEGFRLNYVLKLCNLDAIMNWYVKEHDEKLLGQFLLCCSSVNGSGFIGEGKKLLNMIREPRPTECDFEPMRKHPSCVSF